MSKLKTYFFLYFTQGMPYGLQSRLLPIYFRTSGMSLSNISSFKLLLIPWALKAVWSPFVDSYGKKKMWLSTSFMLLTLICTVSASIPPQFMTSLSISMFLFNVITSIQDIALDSIIIQTLNTEQLAVGNVAQVVGYKFGSLFSGGILAWLSQVVKWEHMFYSLAAIYFAAFIITQSSLPLEVPSSANHTDVIEKSSHRDVILPSSETTSNAEEHFPAAQQRAKVVLVLQKIFDVPGTWWMLMYASIYKIGEQGVVNMFPMFLLDKSISPHDVGFWTGFVGQFFSIAGSAAGGFCKTGNLLSTLKVLQIVRAVVIFFLWLTIIQWQFISSISYPFSLLCMNLVFLIGGVISTLTFALFMQLSQHAPTSCQGSHYTFITSAEVMGKLLFSVSFGTLIQWTGYSFVFAVFSLVSIGAVIVTMSAPAAVHPS